MKTTTKTATVRHTCSQTEIRAHLQAIERRVIDRSADKVQVSWSGPLTVDVVIPLVTSSVTGTVDASTPGEVSISVQGPSVIMGIFRSTAATQIEQIVREQLGDKHLGTSIAR